MASEQRRGFGQVYLYRDHWCVKWPNGRKTPAGRTAYSVRRVSGKKAGLAFLAELRRAQLAGTLRNNKPTVAKGLTVAQAVRDYIESVEAAGRSDGTLQQYGISLKAIEASGLGGMAIEHVRREDIEAFLLWRRSHTWRTRVGKKGVVTAEPVKGKKASASVLYRDRGVLAATFNRLVDLDVLDKSVVKRVSTPKKRQTILRPFELEEIKSFLAACDPDQLRPIVMAGLYTGQGGKELIGLRWRDISFARYNIAVLRQKTGKVIEIPLHADLAADLQRLRERRTAATGRIPLASEHVFQSRYGRPYQRFPRGAWQEAIKCAGLSGRGLTPHSMRRTFATYFPGEDVDCQRILGHTDIKTTMIYRRSRDGRTREAVNRLDYGLSTASGQGEHTHSTHAMGNG